MSVVVFADAYQGKLAKAAAEVVTYGAKVAAQMGTECFVLTYGNVDAAEVAKLGQYGAKAATIARNITDADAQQLTKAVALAVEAHSNGNDVVIFSHDFTGKAVAPRVAARLGAGLVAGAVDLPDMSAGFTVKKAVFSGKAFANVTVTSDRKVVSLLPNSIQPEASGADCDVSEINPEVGTSGVTVKEFRAKGGGGVPLTEAELVVSAGRGLKDPGNWGMVEELANVLGAATACSRPVADIGWRPHHEHVGQTGITVRPNLYIAIGISGAIQHLAGVNQSKTIVVINTDPEAPFFKAADYGIVGDAFDVVPKLLDAVKSFQSN